MSGTVRRLLVGLAVIMLLAAGCGDDGGSADEVTFSPSPDGTRVSIVVHRPDG